MYQKQSIPLSDQISALLDEVEKEGFVLHEVLDELPCHVHINSAKDFSLEYLSKYARDLFDIPIEKIENEGAELLREKVHPIDLEKAITITQHYLNNLEDYKSISFIQRIKLNTGEYAPFFTTSIFLKEHGLVSFTARIDTVKLSGRTINDIIDETDFIREKFHLFSRLTKREIELIVELVGGKSLKEISSVLDLTYETVKSYKKRIYNKLEINQFFELFKYAQAFDLINTKNGDLKMMS